MGDKGKSDQQIEREERLRVAMENTRGTMEEARSQQYQRRLKRQRTVTRTHHANLDNDERLAARAGHSAQRRENDRANHAGAYRAAREADDVLDLFVFNRRSDEYNQHVRAGTERRIRERDEIERAERDRERERAECAEHRREAAKK